MNVDLSAWMAAMSLSWIVENTKSHWSLLTTLAGAFPSTHQPSVNGSDLPVQQALCSMKALVGPQNSSRSSSLMETMGLFFELFSIGTICVPEMPEWFGHPKIGLQNSISWQLTRLEQSPTKWFVDSSVSYTFHFTHQLFLILNSFLRIHLIRLYSTQYHPFSSIYKIL